MEKMIWIVTGALLLAGSLRAGENCHDGGGDTGKLEFSAVQDGSRFTGRFENFSVEYCWPGDAAPADGAIRVSVRPASAVTNNRDRDQTLESDEFFAVDAYPESTWVSREISRDGDGYRATGELTIRDITRQQPVTFSLERVEEGWRMRGEAEVRRLDYDVGTGEFADTDFIGNRVGIAFDLVLAPAG